MKVSLIAQAVTALALIAMALVFLCGFARPGNSSTGQAEFGWQFAVIFAVAAVGTLLRLIWSLSRMKLDSVADVKR